MKYYKQCAALVDHNNAITMGSALFAAQDYEHNGSIKKRYMVFTGGPSVYFADTRDERPTSDYELIPAHRPVKLYLDVEREFDNGTSDGERWAPQIRADLTRLLGEFLDESIPGWRERSPGDAQPELLWMSASSGHKLSLHGILHGVHFLGVHVLKAVVDTFVATKLMPSKLDALVYTDSAGKSCTVIDDKVYTRNRCFRLPYAQKLGNQDPKRVLMPAPGVNPADYLVTVLPPHSKLLRWPGDHAIEKSQWSPFELFLKLTPPKICRSIGNYFVHAPKSSVKSDHVRVAWLEKSDREQGDEDLARELPVLSCDFDIPRDLWFQNFLPQAVSCPGIYHWCASFRDSTTCRLAVDIDGLPEGGEWSEVVDHIKHSLKALQAPMPPRSAPHRTSPAAESPGSRQGSDVDTMAATPDQRRTADDSQGNTDLDFSCALVENPLKPGHGHLYFHRVILPSCERVPLLNALHERFKMRWPRAQTSFDPAFSILRFWGCINRDPRAALTLTRWWKLDGVMADSGPDRPSPSDLWPTHLDPDRCPATYRLHPDHFPASKQSGLRVGIVSSARPHQVVNPSDHQTRAAAAAAANPAARDDEAPEAAVRPGTPSSKVNFDDMPHDEQDLLRLVVGRYHARVSAAGIQITQVLVHRDSAGRNSRMLAYTNSGHCPWRTVAEYNCEKNVASKAAHSHTYKNSVYFVLARKKITARCTSHRHKRVVGQPEKNLELDLIDDFTPQELNSVRAGLFPRPEAEGVRPLGDDAGLGSVRPRHQTKSSTPELPEIPDDNTHPHPEHRFYVAHRQSLVPLASAPEPNNGALPSESGSGSHRIPNAAAGLAVPVELADPRSPNHLAPAAVYEMLRAIPGVSAHMSAPLEELDLWSDPDHASRCWRIGCKSPRVECVLSLLGCQVTALPVSNGAGVPDGPDTNCPVLLWSGSDTKLLWLGGWVLAKLFPEDLKVFGEHAQTPGPMVRDAQPSPMPPVVLELVAFCQNLHDACRSFLPPDSAPNQRLWSVHPKKWLVICSRSMVSFSYSRMAWKVGKRWRTAGLNRDLQRQCGTIMRRHNQTGFPVPPPVEFRRSAIREWEGWMPAENIHTCDDRPSNREQADYIDAVADKILKGEKLTLLEKGSHGSGKTKMAQALVKRLPPGTLVVSISHLTALAKKSASWYGIPLYNNGRTHDHQNREHVDPRLDLMSLSTTVNSIEQAAARNPTVLILDEFCSILGALCGSHLTQGGKLARDRVNSMVEGLVQRAQCVLAMDADLCSAIEGRYLARLRDRSTFQLRSHRWRWEYGGYSVHHHPTPQGIKAELMRCLRETPDKHLVIAGSNLKQLKELEAMIRAELESQGRATRCDVRLISTETDPSARARLSEDPDHEMGMSDILIYSPVIQSGVSIETHHYDALFLLFDPGSCPPNVAFQMVWRVRKLRQPASIHLHVLHPGCGREESRAAQRTAQLVADILHSKRNVMKYQQQSAIALTPIAEKWDRQNACLKLRLSSEQAEMIALTAEVAARDERDRALFEFNMIQRFRSKGLSVKTVLGVGLDDEELAEQAKNARGAVESDRAEKKRKGQESVLAQLVKSGAAEGRQNHPEFQAFHLERLELYPLENEVVSSWPWDSPDNPFYQAIADASLSPPGLVATLQTAARVLGPSIIAHTRLTQDLSMHPAEPPGTRLLASPREVAEYQRLWALLGLPPWQDDRALAAWTVDGGNGDDLGEGRADVEKAARVLRLPTMPKKKVTLVRHVLNAVGLQLRCSHKKQRKRSTHAVGDDNGDESAGSGRKRTSTWVLDMKWCCDYWRPLVLAQLLQFGSTIRLASGVGSGIEVVDNDSFSPRSPPAASLLGRQSESRHSSDGMHGYAAPVFLVSSYACHDSRTGLGARACLARDRAGRRVTWIEPAAWSAPLPAAASEAYVSRLPPGAGAPADRTSGSSPPSSCTTSDWWMALMAASGWIGREPAVAGMAAATGLGPSAMDGPRIGAWNFEQEGGRGTWTDGHGLSHHFWCWHDPAAPTCLARVGSLSREVLLAMGCDPLQVRTYGPSKPFALEWVSAHNGRPGGDCAVNSTTVDAREECLRPPPSPPPLMAAVVRLANTPPRVGGVVPPEPGGASSPSCSGVGAWINITWGAISQQWWQGPGGGGLDGRTGAVRLALEDCSPKTVWDDSRDPIGGGGRTVEGPQVAIIAATDLADWTFAHHIDVVWVCGRAAHDAVDAKGLQKNAPWSVVVKAKGYE